MLIPIGTDIEQRRQPIVTYWIIGLNLLIFALQWATSRSGGNTATHEFVRFIAELEVDGQLSSSQFHVWSLVTYQFLHGGWMHIIVNMLFLLPFGKAVEDRMGHLGFALFYLGCGAFGGLIHTLLYASPVIGASGSVCSVVAAFIVLAPKTKIRVLLIFFIIGIYTVPSLLLVGFFVLLDTFSLLASVAGNTTTTTAWVVHLCGYLSGFAVTFIALSLGLIISTQFDLTQMIRQSYRRRSLQKVIDSPPVLQTNKKLKDDPDFLLSTSIAKEATSGDINIAVVQYLEAIAKKPSFKIDPRTLHMIGTTLIQANRIEEGVQVFEIYLLQYKHSKDRGEVALLLAAKYSRDLNNAKRASELLKKYASDFSEQHQKLATTITNELIS